MIGTKSIKDYMAAVDHHIAMDFIFTLAAKEEPIGERVARKINALVLARNDPVSAGDYTEVQLGIQASKAMLPSPLDVPHLMRTFGEDLG